MLSQSNGQTVPQFGCSAGKCSDSKVFFVVSLVRIGDTKMLCFHTSVCQEGMYFLDVCGRGISSVCFKKVCIFHVEFIYFVCVSGKCVFSVWGEQCYSLQSAGVRQLVQLQCHLSLPKVLFQWHLSASCLGGLLRK